MSKFLKVMIVLLTIAAVAAPAFAEDRLGLSGEMRVRGWLTDDGSDTTSWADERLRIGGKFSIAEGVSVSFRTDVTERTWGAGGSEFGSGRMPQDGQQWDRAYMDLAMGNFSLRAGQQYVGYGLLGGTINSQDAGFSVSMKGPVAVSAFWLLDDNRGAAADSYLSAVKVGHKTDAYAANVFVGNQIKALDADENVYLLGVNATMNLNAIKLAAEVDYFFGDATANQDAIGLQTLIDASMAAGDAATVGAQFMFAMAADDDGSEVQYQNLGNDFNGWDPIVDVGTKLSNEQINVIARPYDFTKANAGLIGLRGYGSFKAGDALNLGASLAYLLPADDDMAEAVSNIDSAVVFAAGAVYKVMANTSLHAQFQYEMVSASQGSDPDDEYQAGMGLYVNF